MTTKADATILTPEERERILRLLDAIWELEADLAALREERDEAERTVTKLREDWRAEIEVTDSIRDQRDRLAAQLARVRAAWDAAQEAVYAQIVRDTNWAPHIRNGAIQACTVADKVMRAALDGDASARGEE